eukprot:6195893-Pleurochrysis_carterae.AAC.1
MGQYLASRPDLVPAPIVRTLSLAHMVVMCAIIRVPRSIVDKHAHTPVWLADVPILCLGGVCRLKIASDESQNGCIISRARNDEC